MYYCKGSRLCPNNSEKNLSFLAELIRAAIDALRESKLDLTPATSESRIKNIILEKIS